MGIKTPITSLSYLSEEAFPIFSCFDYNSYLMETLKSYFGTANLSDFYTGAVAQRAISQRGREVAELVGNGRSIGIRLDNQLAWTFRVEKEKVAIYEGADQASLVISSDGDSWSDLVTEAWSMMGLAIQGRIKIEHGSFNHLAKWEPALQALYNDRPIWFPEKEEAIGTHVFSMNDDRKEMMNALSRLGFILVRSVFVEEEIEMMRSEVEERRQKASPEDKRSWWATNAQGEERCCRVTYLNYGSEFFSNLPNDSRLLTLAALSERKLSPAPHHGDGVAVVIKVPGITEGLSDLPWHRDCGMGGHPLLCPGLNMGIQLDHATAESGQLKFLAGSNNYSGGADYANDSASVIPIEASPGDVTLHYGHTLHIAPPPIGGDNYRRTVYVSFHIPEYQNVLPEGQGYNDVLFTHGDGRVRAPQERMGED